MPILAHGGVPRIHFLVHNILFHVFQFILESVPWEDDYLKSSYFKQQIAHPHLLVWAINERFLPVGTTSRIGLANESHSLQLVLVLNVHWWPALVSVSGL